MLTRSAASMKLRRSGRLLTQPRVTSTPYKAPRKSASKPKPKPKPKPSLSQEYSPIKLEPSDDEMPESELTGWIRDIKKRPTTTSKRSKQPKSKSKSTTTSPGQHDGLSKKPSPIPVLMPMEPIPKRVEEPKSHVVVPNIVFDEPMEASQSSPASNINQYDDDDDIQFLGVTPSVVTTPTVVLPKPIRPKYASMAAIGICTMVNKRRKIRFRNCTTEKLEVHIQSADFPDYDHVYILDNQCWTSTIRFQSARAIGAENQDMFVETDVLPDGTFNIYEFGKGLRHDCFSRAESFEGETVRFFENLLFVKYSEACTINEDQTRLVVHHPRGDFTFIYDHQTTDIDGLDGVFYAAECGCRAGAILTESDVWVNYFHYDTCILRRQTRSDGTYQQHVMISNNHQRYTIATGPTTKNGKSTFQSQPNQPIKVESKLTNLTLPSDLKNGQWLRSLHRYHMITANFNVAGQYWNRVDVTRSMAKWIPIACELGPVDIRVLVSHLLTGSDAHAEQLEQFFKSRFEEQYDLIGTFENVNYQNLHRNSPMIRSVINYQGYCSALLMFAARYFKFRLFVLKNGRDFRHYGDWLDESLPVAVISCANNDKYEIATGMYGIYQ